jgi:hypothetical protein
LSARSKTTKLQRLLQAYSERRLRKFSSVGGFSAPVD